MARFSLKSLPESQRIQLIGEFYDVVASLKNREEVRAFLRDLLAADEIAMLMRRIEAATLLIAGYSSHAIEVLTGIGKETTRAVQRKISQADRGGGYRIVAKRLLTARKKRIQKNRHTKEAQINPLKQMKRRYKTYFLFNHILDEIIDCQERKAGKSLEKDVLTKTPSRMYR